MRWKRMLTVASLLLCATSAAGQTQSPTLPVLVPLTGFLSLEGTSQRNGAELAIADADKPNIAYDISDTGTSPEVAVNAFLRAMDQDDVRAVVAPMLGTQMLALLPLAVEYEMPLLTVSGTASITEQGNPYIFRFFPADSVVKRAHARYAVEELGAKRPAIIFQTTAYGQSGRTHLVDNLTELGSPPILEEPLDVGVKDMLPVLIKARQADADALLLHLHAGPTALVVRQAAAMGFDIPIIAGSAMHQPATAALLEPAELTNVCAETGSSPVSGGDPEIDAFTKRYMESYGTQPDAFALHQYDAVRMYLRALQSGAGDAEAVRAALASEKFEGLAMTYKSDGNGNMAHDAVIICYDGTSRTPKIVKRYENISGVL